MASLAYEVFRQLTELSVFHYTYEKRERFPLTSIYSGKTSAIETRRRFDRYDPKLVDPDARPTSYVDLIFAGLIVTT